MLKEYLMNYVQIKEFSASWEDAISSAAQPLVADNLITSFYVDSMIRNIQKNGSYVVIMPQIALPHSRSEDGVINTCLSILKLDRPVMFPQNKEVKLVIVLAAKDNHSHMNLLSELADLLMDQSRISKILSCNNVNELYKLLESTNERL